MKRIILASQSPRRRKLLEQIGLKFEVVPSNIDEDEKSINNPRRLVKNLAMEKAKIVSQKVKDGIVIAADSVVVFNGEIIGKPKDDKDAFAILKKLSGNFHDVFTGLVVMDANNGKTLSDVVKSKVKFREIPDEEIMDYVKTGEPLDKAGGYGAQERAAVFLESVDGCFFNIVGLPIAKLVEMLKEFGVDVLKEGQVKKVG